MDHIMVDQLEPTEYCWYCDAWC